MMELCRGAKVARESRTGASRKGELDWKVYEGEFAPVFWLRQKTMNGGIRLAGVGILTLLLVLAGAATPASSSGMARDLSGDSGPESSCTLPSSCVPQQPPTGSCSGETLPTVVRLSSDQMLQQGLLYLVKGPMAVIAETFAERQWEETFPGTMHGVALVQPGKNTSWPPASVEGLSDPQAPDSTEVPSIYNAWRIVEGWHPPFVMYAPLDGAPDVVSLGVFQAGWTISGLTLDHLNYIHNGQERHAWVYLVRADGTEVLLKQVEIADPAAFSILVSERGEIQIRTHDSTLWWTQCLPPLTLAVTKTAQPESRPEPGGQFAFTVRIDNPSPVALTLLSLQDNVYGNIVGQGSGLLEGTTCSVPQLLPSQGSYACGFTTRFLGQPGDSQTDVVTAVAQDAQGRRVQASDEATVLITNVPSAIEVTKTARPFWLMYPGGEVTYSFTVKNVSPVDVVTIDRLIDSIYGDLNGKGTCRVPQRLSVGGSFSCSFATYVSGEAGQRHVNTVTASGVDDDGQPVSGQDTAEVRIAYVPARVDLISFAASPGEDRIAIEWETASEQDHWGFNLYRGTAPDFENASWIGFEAAEGGDGRTYRYEDGDVVLGRIYYYWLEDVDAAGTKTQYGPATAMLVRRVFLPVISH